MNDFKTLDDIYNIIDDPKFETDDFSKISSMFQKCRDSYQKEGNESEAMLSQRNMEFVDFNITENKLHPMISDTIKDGLIIPGYPSLDQFDVQAYQLLKLRLQQTKNKYLKIQYGHLLWLTYQREFIYAKEAIENYLNLIPFFILESNNQTLHSDMAIVHYIKNLYYISKQTKYRFYDAQEIVLQFFRHNFQLPAEYRIKLEIGNLLSQERKVFKNKVDFSIADIFWTTYKKLFNEKELWPSLDILFLGVRFMSAPDIIKVWNREIAAVYEELMNINISEMAALDFCQKAIKYYDLAEDYKKIQELKNKEQKLKENLPLGELKLGLDFTEERRSFEKEAKKISELPFIEIIRLLTFDKSILPTKEFCEKAAEENIKQQPMHYLIDAYYYDQKGNTSKKVSHDEKLYQFMLDNYRIQLNHLHIPFIHWIIYYSVANGKINTSNLINHFVENSWFGKDLEQRVFSKSVSYNWLEAVMPAINDYITKLKYTENNKFYHVSYIMCIDSLTLKIEGLLRDFLQIQGISTTKQKNNREEIITEEKDLNELLYEDKVTELFDEDDLLFLRYLLVEKTGFNLRNGVAHSLLLPQQYSVEFMHLLFLAVLKIGSFNVTLRNI
ncbi:MAG: DUF4209 domain-containing protein [Bacteroidetes bacterium]|nr:DUF4209 domain-containing protein [Bacteroidota bacterium]